MRIFISCVSTEFRTYRDELRRYLSSAGRDIKIQEDFVDGGGTLLEKLDDYIQRCQAIVHLVGKGCGARAKPAEIRAILGRHPHLWKELPELADVFDPNDSPLTYTQWEVLLAIHHRVPRYIYLAGAESKREQNWQECPDERAAQDAHVARLRSLGEDRSMFPFIDARDVALRFLTSYLDQVSPARSAHIAPPGARTVWPSLTEPLSHSLADREHETGQFIRIVTGQSAKRLYLIRGPSDRGKSTLLAHFARVIGNMRGLHCGHAEFKDAPELKDVLCALSRDLRPLRFPRFQREYDRNATETMRTAFLQDLDEGPEPVLLMLDAYEQASEEARRWVEQCLLPHARGQAGLCLVLAGQHVPAPEPGRPWAELAELRDLPPITETHHWFDYARRVMGITGYREDQIEVLLKISQGSPRVLGSHLSILKQSHA